MWSGWTLALPVLDFIFLPFVENKCKKVRRSAVYPLCNRPLLPLIYGAAHKRLSRDVIQHC